MKSSPSSSSSPSRNFPSSLLPDILRLHKWYSLCLGVKPNYVGDIIAKIELLFIEIIVIVHDRISLWYITLIYSKAVISYLLVGLLINYFLKASGEADNFI